MHVEDLFRRGLTDSIVIQKETFLVRFQTGKDTRNLHTLRVDFVSDLGILALPENIGGIRSYDVLRNLSDPQLYGRKGGEFGKGYSRR